MGDINMPRRRRRSLPGLFPLCLGCLTALLLLGCGQDEAATDKDGGKKEVSVQGDEPILKAKSPSPEVKPRADKSPESKPGPEKSMGDKSTSAKTGVDKFIDDFPKGASKRIPIGKNVTLEINGDKRRVLVQAFVCLRMGQLEQFLTRKRTKEHEAILAAEVDAREIHAALLLTGAEPGSPVQFRPKYQPASGSLIRVLLRYEKDGNTLTVPAQHWIRNIKTKKDMDFDWVFAGSQLIPDPLDKNKKPFYAANDGDVICLSNFETAMLDLPIPSTGSNDDLFFEAHTERLPPVDTPVTVILELLPLEKKGKR